MNIVNNQYELEDQIENSFPLEISCFDCKKPSVLPYKMLCCEILLCDECLSKSNNYCPKCLDKSESVLDKKVIDVLKWYSKFSINLFSILSSKITIPVKKDNNVNNLNNVSNISNINHSGSIIKESSIYENSVSNIIKSRSRSISIDPIENRVKSEKLEMSNEKSSFNKDKDIVDRSNAKDKKISIKSKELEYKKDDKYYKRKYSDEKYKYKNKKNDKYYDDYTDKYEKIESDYKKSDNYNKNNKESTYNRDNRENKYEKEKQYRKNDYNDNYKKDIDSKHKYSIENTNKEIQINISTNDNMPKKEIILNKEKRELVVILKNDKKD